MRSARICCSACSLGADRRDKELIHFDSEGSNGGAEQQLKRGYQGTLHKFSKKHLDRYVREFAGRHNIRPRDTLDMMQSVAIGMEGKRLRYRDLTADNGLPSGARS